MDVNDYFRSETNRRLEVIEGKIDKLLAFKWQIVGGSIFGGGIISIIIAITAELLKKWQ